jgi:large subunit ribosomal protein L22
MLFVKEVRVDPGPMMKRGRSAPMGRALPIKKRFSHAVIALEAAEEKIEQKPRVPKAAKPADKTGGKTPAATPKKQETQPKPQVAESDKK